MFHGIAGDRNLAKCHIFACRIRQIAPGLSTLNLTGDSYFDISAELKCRGLAHSGAREKCTLQNIWPGCPHVLTG